jgi:hypothetical protein
VSGWKQQGWPSNSAQAFLFSLQEIEAFGYGMSRAQCSQECCICYTFLLLVIFGQLAGICHQVSATARLITKHGPKDVNPHSKEHQYARSTYPVSYGRSRKKKSVCTIIGDLWSVGWNLPPVVGNSWADYKTRTKGCKSSSQRKPICTVDLFCELRKKLKEKGRSIA